MTLTKRLLLHAGLFLATFLTTTAAGAMLMHARVGVEGWEAILPIADGLSYSLPLMLILLSHELGHYLLASKIHTPKGLMKASRTAFEFFAPEHGGFAIEAGQTQVLVARLRNENRTSNQ